LKWLIKAYQTTNNKSKFFNLFTKLAGTKITTANRSRISESKIRESWKKLEAFKMRKKLIY
jgi:hypothetical protein